MSVVAVVLRAQYDSGRLAGLEHAARICEAYAERHDSYARDRDSPDAALDHAAACAGHDLARDIRAELTPPAPAVPEDPEPDIPF